MGKWLAASVLVVLFSAIYAPALGHGFMKDDFRWVDAAEVRSIADLDRIFTTNVGFYRPLVTVSFAMDRMVWGLDPRGYALTNALLLAADAGLLFLLASRLSLPAPAALFAVAAWVFNFHGINMALLWMSGRTALLLCLFAQASVLAALHKRPVLAAALALGAMLCKEEAVMLPLVVIAAERLFLQQADGVRPHDTRRLTGSDPMTWIDSWGLTPFTIGGLVVAVALYVVLRGRSGAFGLSDAPDYYRLVFAPASVLRNAAQYLDRGATVAAVAAAAMWLVAPAGRVLDDGARRTVVFGSCWFVAFFAITVFVPYRSSLYAVAPSLGSALVAATIAARTWHVAPARFARVSATLIAIVALLIPVYRSRNHGFVEPEDLAMQSLTAMQREALQHPETHEIVLVDEPAAPVSLDDAFGGLLPEATHLFLGATWRASIAGATTSASAETGALVFQLREGRLVQDE